MQQPTIYNKIQAGDIWTSPFSTTIDILNPENIDHKKLLAKDINTSASRPLEATTRTDKREEDVGGDVNYFGTGINIKAPQGYHYEVFPHPELCRTGYMLLGPIVIDSTHEGEIILPLLKFRAESEDLNLPHTVAQIVLRQTQHNGIQNLAPVVATQKDKSVRPVAKKIQRFG